MEQPIGSKVPPTHAAGVDPAYVPGLLPPRPAADAAAAPEKAAEEVEDAPAAETADVKEPAAEAAADDDAPDRKAAVPPEGDDAADAEEDAGEEDVDDGLPVFEVSDRRGSITADRRGVTFTLDGEVAEFGWDEVQAVEIDTPRFSRRFGVTVYTSTRRWFQSDVEAPSRGELKAWAAQLDEVLDARFEEGGEPEESAAADAPEAVEAADVASDEVSDETAADEDGEKAGEDNAGDEDGEKSSAETKGAQARA